jgi:hypothetical protein
LLEPKQHLSKQQEAPLYLSPQMEAAVEDYTMSLWQCYKMVVVVEVRRAWIPQIFLHRAQLRKGLCHRTSHTYILPQALQFSLRKDM